MASRPDTPIEDGDETTGKDYPSIPAPDPEADPAETVEDKGEPSDGNFA